MSYPVSALVGFASLAVAASYAVIALLAVLVWNRPRAATNSARLPPVTILKPLCGAEPGLYANLRSFCLQNYPEYQIVFGVRDVGGSRTGGGGAAGDASSRRYRSPSWSIRSCTAAISRSVI